MFVDYTGNSSECLELVSRPMTFIFKYGPRGEFVSFEMIFLSLKNHAQHVQNS
jgi:hypothetical protein